MTLIRAIFSTRSTLRDLESIDKLFHIIIPVIKDPDEGAASSGEASSATTPATEGGEDGEDSGEGKSNSLEEEQVSTISPRLGTLFPSTTVGAVLMIPTSIDKYSCW